MFLYEDKRDKEEVDDTSDNDFHDAEDSADEMDTLEEKFSDALDLNESAEGQSEPEEDQSQLSEEELQERKEQADKLKLDGNVSFKDAEYEKALDLYTEAISICPRTYTVERAILFANRAAAHKHLGAPNPAIDDCTKAIEQNPNYVKAYVR